MATLDSLAMARLMAASQGGAVETSATGSAVLWIRWLGTTDSGATFEVSTDINFTTDGSTADTTVNTTGTIDISTPGATTNTCGKIAALINASANWECILLGYRPEDGTDDLIGDFTATDISTAAYKDDGLFVYGDGAITPYNTCIAISGFMPSVARDVTLGDPDVGCYSVLQTIECYCDRSAACTIYVYSANQTDSTLLWSGALADTTQTNLGTEGGFMFRSRNGDRIIVTIRNDQTGATEILRITGYSIDMSNANPRQGFVLTNALL